MAGEADYVILDTDYRNYAVIYECQNVLNFLGLFQVHRKSGAILIRDLKWNNGDVFKDVSEPKALFDANSKCILPRHAENCSTGALTWTS